MSDIITRVSELVPHYFIEPDIFEFTQTHWELGNKLYDTDVNGCNKLLTEAGLSDSELLSFENQLLKVKSIVEGN